MTMNLRDRPLPMNTRREVASASGVLATAAFMIVFCCHRADRPVAWSTEELATELAILEESAESLNGHDEAAAVGAFARRAVHRPIKVSGARVSSVYERGPEWRTRPYFALSYDRETYVYLETIAPEFQADLASHRHWASVGQTVNDRQLMFELALSETDFELLQPRCRVDFTCELAAVIRGGRSVYCRALSVSVFDCLEAEL